MDIDNNVGTDNGSGDWTGLRGAKGEKLGQ